MGLRDGVGGGLVIRTVRNFDDVETQCYAIPKNLILTRPSDHN